ncbi:hypothetical protein Tco_0780018 [Tanacetum coccineum]
MKKMNEDEKLMLALMMLSNKLPLERHAYRFEQAPFVKGFIFLEHGFSTSLVLYASQLVYDRNAIVYRHLLERKVDMVLVSRNEIEPGMDFSAPREAQESLINETNIELNPEQVNQEAEQIISDGDKAFLSLTVNKPFKKLNKLYQMVIKQILSLTVK